MDSLYQFIFDNGSGNVSADLAMLTLSLVVLLQGFFLSVFSRKVDELEIFVQKFEKSSQAGKIQKIEDNINLFRTEILRAIADSKKAEVIAEIQPLSETQDVSEAESSKKNVAVEEIAQAEFQPQAQKELVKAESLQVELAQEEPKKEIVQRRSVFEGLSRTRSSLIEKIKSVFSNGQQLSAENLEELEAQLVGSDMGIALTSKLLEELKTDLKGGQQLGQSDVVDILKLKIEKILVNGSVPSEPEAAAIKVILMVGVNGAGKTTTSAKLAHEYKNQGKKVLLVAADTFRAAAVDQLKIWADRLDVEVLIGAENSKPSTVVFEAMEKAKADGFEVVIIDTAGRLQNKSNLMQELSGVKNAVSRHIEGQPSEVLLVVDGASGQNAISQAREFQEAAGITGVIVTKLDGTPKGGSVVAIKSELGIPVRYIGVGEGIEDLRSFDAHEFAAALLG
jgi:fused signal recognition particle receptor